MGNNTTLCCKGDIQYFMFKVTTLIMKLITHISPISLLAYFGKVKRIDH